MSLEINPQRLRGPWAEGFALHVHSLSSTYLGDDQWGHARFRTTRSPIGEALYQLKYRRDLRAVAQLAGVAARFCREQWKLQADAIVAVPPSQARRAQPVALVAAAVAEALELPVCRGLRKVRKTPQIKDLTDYHERVEVLQSAFEVDPRETKGRRLLLLDDLYGSGATARVITELLMNLGSAKSVHLLTLTKRASA